MGEYSTYRTTVRRLILRYVALYYGTWPYRYGTWPYATVRGLTLRYVALSYGTWPYPTVRRLMLRYVALCYSTYAYVLLVVCLTLLSVSESTPGRMKYKYPPLTIEKTDYSGTVIYEDGIGTAIIL